VTGSASALLAASMKTPCAARDTGEAFSQRSRSRAASQQVRASDRTH
jgi:hypothetical protein